MNNGRDGPEPAEIAMRAFIISFIFGITMLSFAHLAELADQAADAQTVMVAER